MDKGKHRQPTTKNHPILSLISEHNFSISSGTLHWNVNLCTTVCNANIGKM
jgi:hypothetical protein